MPTSRQIIVQAGWYECPTGAGQLRWWDGFKWSELVAESTSVAEAAAVDYDDEVAARRSLSESVTWEIPVVEAPTSCLCCGDSGRSHESDRLQLTA